LHKFFENNLEYKNIMESFDVVVIGSGPGGYVSAIRSAQLGFSTAIIEKYPTLGGTCLNVGCIPSKALLDSSHHYYEAISHFQEHGFSFSGDLNINIQKMIERKQTVIDQTCAGIKFLMDKNKITVFEGIGSFDDTTHIKIIKNDNSTQIIEAKNTIIATGSKPAILPFVTIDKERIITSTEALKMKEIPKHLVVIGGGVIGLELGQVYSRLGSQVSVVEYADRIIPNMDAGLSKELTKILKKQGIKFYTSHQVKSVERNGDYVQIKAENTKDETIILEGDYALISVGRKPYTYGLDAQKIGIKINEKGQIETNERLQTDIPNIYAIGDVIKGVMLAHKAEEEGVFVAETIANQKPHINYNLIPSVVYTWPEVAGIGKTEEQLKAEQIQYKVGTFSFKALGRARASMDTDGFVKIVADKQTDEILGMHIIGARAADLIAEGVTAMEFRASSEDLTRMSHAHPTFSEAIKEAALATTDNRAIHS